MMDVSLQDTLTPEDDTTYTEQDRTQNIPCTDTTANDQILSTPGGRREVPTVRHTHLCLND